MCYWKDDQLYTKSTCFFLDDFPLTSYLTDAELLDTTTLETGPVRSKSSVWGSCWWTFRANWIFLRSIIGWGRLGTTRKGEDELVDAETELGKIGKEDDEDFRRFW